MKENEELKKWIEADNEEINNSDRYHPVNRKLDEVEDMVKGEYGPSWKRWQQYKVEYHFITDLNEGI